MLKERSRFTINFRQSVKSLTLNALKITSNNVIKIMLNEQVFHESIMFFELKINSLTNRPSITISTTANIFK
jgi:hypothetical protein